MRRIGVPLVCILLSQAAAAQVNPAQPRIPEITASGRGEVPVTPDRATVFVSVESRAPTASAAATDNSSRMSAVLAALKRAGLSQSDITTTAYNVGQDPRSMRIAPGMPGVPTMPVEFLARNGVRATVRRTEDVSKVIDAALAAGATTISSVQFSSPNTDDARRQAISSAVAQAQRDADAMARAAGGSLGRLLGISSFPSPVMAGGVASDTYFSVAEGFGGMYPTTINPRDVTVTVMVTGRWEFVAGSK